MLYESKFKPLNEKIESVQIDFIKSNKQVVNKDRIIAELKKEMRRKILEKEKEIESIANFVT